MASELVQTILGCEAQPEPENHSGWEFLCLMIGGFGAKGKRVIVHQQQSSSIFWGRCDHG
jgi:hypothetical protein